MEFEERILATVGAMIDKHVQPSGAGIDHEDKPLLAPRTEGRNVAGDKKQISVRVDANLADLFKEESKKHLNNESRTMDIILWRHFNRPKRSFED